jgi:Mg-chelatase subunit ChlD
MERAGLSFARFVRALRMGLGDRHGDPKVRAGLDLFKQGFRKRDMQGLLDVSHALRDIFGWEVRLVECMGTHESLKSSVRDGLIHGDGIEDAEVQDEVERILDPRQIDHDGPPRSGKRRLAINVADDERFDPITRVEKVPYDPVARRELAEKVKRHAVAMRRVLEELGLAFDPRRFRLRGRRFDPTRTRAVVTRGDPRMLIARERVVKSDLFLGVLVDCSGSMHGESIERARLFATLLAEAAKGMPGVDVRVFGFTHEVIWDAGDAVRCAAASLEADGGNNDAAALLHVATVAKNSLRKAKLLVMISDGLPTECSVAALKGLVQKLTRREKMCCAQVAVRPLEEICFPHYVLLEEAEIDPAVRRFGVVVTGLVRRAMSA